jgi:small-conductance mechanosensitive channel
MDISNWIEQHGKVSPDLQSKLFFSLLLIVILVLIRHFALRIIFKSIEDVKERYFWKNGIRNTFYALLVIVLTFIWVDKIGSLATFLGIITAGLAIALQDPLVNIAGWLFIWIRRPFEIGDRIQIGDFSGDVIDVRFFQFTINEINHWVDADQSTGRIVHIPNGQVFKISQANYSQGFGYIWNEMGVLLTFESNWEKAKEILEKIVGEQAEQLSGLAKKKLVEASKKYMIFYTNLTPIVYTSVKDSGVNLTMRYLVDPRKRRSSEHKIWEAVLKAFKANDDIDFAYPTQRIYYNLQEGKTGTVKKPNYPSSAKS